MRIYARRAAMVWLICIALLIACASAQATTYYVDFHGGSDAGPGTSAGQAFQHCPGDRQAADVAAATELAPGDTVLFKGGVVYRGSIEARQSGAPGRPIIYDGNTAGTFGRGRAIIDGSEPLTGWKRCASAADCGGNPNWRSIYYTDAPEGTNPFWSNLAQGGRLLAVAQDPNLDDPFYEDDLSCFQPITPPNPASLSGLQIIKGPGMAENSSRPYVIMFDGDGGTSAILDPCAGASMTFRFDPAVTVNAFAMQASTSYTMPRQFTLAADGRQVLSAELKNERGLQRFELPRPVTFRELTLQVQSTYDGGPGYAAIAEIQGYDAEGRNVLLSPPVMRYADAGYFTQDDPHYWDGGYFVIWAGSNMVYRRKVLGFEPKEHAVTFEMLTVKQYRNTGKFAMMNALGILDRPGEYVVDEAPRPDGTRRIYVWPLDETGGPKGITRSVRGIAFSLRGASHVTVQGFTIRRQGAVPTAQAITGGGDGCTDVHVLDNEITSIRSARSPTIYLSGVANSSIVGNHIHTNKRCAGITMRSGTDCEISRNVLDKNGATGLILYYSHRVRVGDNLLRGHKGVHANGLTAYLDCSDIVFEGNRVFDGNVCLTTQQCERVTVRNNIFDGHGATSAIGLWNVGTLKDLQILNNLILRGPKESNWAAAIYGGGKGPTGFVIKNNVIDGLSGDIRGDISHNIWTSWGPSQPDRKLGRGEAYVPDLKKLFVDPDNHDYRLRPGSPAIDAGTDVGLDRDIDGTPVPQGAAPDVGPYEYAAE